MWYYVNDFTVYNHNDEINVKKLTVQRDSLLLHAMASTIDHC